ncbi:hypothetical protein [Martelella endophytica]|uniref:hypothetical protein n=1 Tax=Martelella endophytica TaxID=1486262 RepID=UPI000A6087DD|nr:hypothetical protein [Martelella endophytica]
MHTQRAIVAGVESPMILGSIATPVLAETVRSRDAFDFLADLEKTGAQGAFARLGRLGGTADFGRAMLRWRAR